jgi:hypothetical protein
MKNIKSITLFSLLSLALLIASGCSFSTANMSSFKTSSDKDGKTETTDFKTGDPIFARAVISNNPGKVKVKFTLVPEADLEDMKKGESVKELEKSFDLEGDGVATYTLTPNASFPGGSFKINAEMLNENGEKKDGKSVTITIKGGE